MEIVVEKKEAAQDAPRSGAPASAPFLDKGGINVPTRRPPWSKQQWKIRRTILDRLRSWQLAGYECLWVTLTSSPESDGEAIRKHFQVLRKRLSRELDFQPIEYVCVDTREGHGVLHMIWAWKNPRPRRIPMFFVPFEWLQEAWKEIHGAFHVNIKRVRTEDHDARRLSRYIVAQYCGGQNTLVRFSQTKSYFPFSRARTELRRALRELPERYAVLHPLANVVSGEDFTHCTNQLFAMHFRRAWDELVQTRSCSAYGVQFAWWDGELRRV